MGKRLSQNEKLKAVFADDPTYDGLFYYAVKTTKIFCRPSCRSKPPKKENLIFFNTKEQAEEAGYRPCKRCRPDLLTYSPQGEIAQQMKKIYDTFYFSQEFIERNIANLNISKNRSIQIFQEEYQMTPKAYLTTLKITKAKEMLSSTSATVLQIAVDCGFENLSTFYSNFKKQTGISPKEYKKQFHVQEEK